MSRVLRSTSPSGHARALWALPLVLLALAAASLVQPLGCTQTAHYALVKSLADGRPDIDPYQQETCDKSYTDGHFYSAKAPGLAFVLTPLYATLDAAGAVPESPRTAVWLLGLAGNVLPALALALLIAAAASRLVPPGPGRAAAVALAAATLLLPFSTLLFSHALAALLGFAAFLLAWRERERGGSVWLLAAAGALAGYAVTTEYPLALVALAVGAYAVWRRHGWPRAGGAYVAGLVLGVLPLVLFNVWAFGSPTHLSYEDAVVVSGQTGHDVVGAHSEGVFGIVRPSLRVGAELLLSAKGLLVETPFVALGVLGLVLLLRRGLRAEALLCGGIALVYLVYNAGLTTTFGGPFGGDSPGARYLVPALPFLVLASAPVVAAHPLVAGLLAAASALTMLAATATEPMLGNFDTGRWADRVVDGDFTHTVVTLAGGGNGWAAIVPFAALAAAAIAATAGAFRGADGRELGVAVSSLAAWALVASAAPTLLEVDRAARERWGLAAVIALVVAAAGAVLLHASRGPLWLLAGLPLAAFAVPSLDDRTKWALAATLAALALVAAALAYRRAASGSRTGGAAASLSPPNPTRRSTT